MMIFCPECENHCSEEAPFCPKCGHPLKPAAPVATPVSQPLSRPAATPPPPEPQQVVIQAPAWSAGVAAVLSFFIPGLGQLYKGHPLGALVWFSVVAFGYYSLIVPGLILHFCCVVGAMMGDPYRKPHRSFRLS